MSADTSLATPAPVVAAEPSRLLGAAAALATILLWAIGLVITRFGATAGSLSLWDVVFLRMALPAFLLVPLLFRLPAAPAGRSRGRHGLLLVIIMAGAGLPFMLTGSGGLFFAPAAHAGALMPGSMPLFAALLAVLFLGERFTAQRGIGTVLMLLGAIAVGGWQVIGGDGNTWRGDLMFICAGAMWSCYTVALKKSGIGAWQAAAIVYVSAFVLYTPVYLFWLDSRLLTAPIFHIGIQVVQSVASGLLSMAFYGYAVRRLGAAPAAAFAALTPALTALLAVPLLGEWPEPATWGGIVAVSLGVALANGAFNRYTVSNR
ncbi:MAG: DMT family transporter [Ferrovibrio sp.]|uniref:DMT family transporter n=1 Tax=Ferrovibrio sp. TaxID=1917215 RepID=UPI00260DD6AF|nr:DMT family transporter [Ferrovibrio sp.]MCW0236571.1 DMT family transporter [Ferrovibrio sp.]